MAIDPNTGLETQSATQPIPTYQIPAFKEGQNFSFDPNQYLPGIQQQATSIYDPQKAQIQALQSLGQSQYEQSKITTNEQFAKQMQQEIEAINARGGFFSGGALNRQGEIGTAQTRAINDLTMQNQAAQAGYNAQLAGLSAEQAQYIQNQLSNAQGSAYNLWKDARSMYYEDKDRRNAELDAKYGAGYSTASKKQKEKMRAYYRKHGKPKTEAQPVALQHFASGGKTYSFNPYTGEAQVIASGGGTSGSSGTWVVNGRDPVTGEVTSWYNNKTMQVKYANQ